MAQIHVLSSETINRIAAGEVVERPANVVKELAENSIDAGATAVTIEIRGGGIDLIRVTDNGCGIEPSQVRQAFLRHATSKIESAEDLVRLSSLGFRGEALSSIAAVSEVEMMTKTRDSLFGIRAVNETGSAAAQDPASSDVSMQLTEIGAPDGTTVIVRSLFYNVPVRRKFLKSAQTEGSYVTDLVEHLALSHPDISFHYRMNGQEKLHTTGNGSIPELIYRIYGKEMSRSMVPFAGVDSAGGISVNGYLGRPEFSRSSRSFERFFVNGRMLRSDVLSKGLEEGYRTDLMQHRFPFAIVYLTVPPERIDVNVHPSKMEVRFTDPKAVYDLLNESVHAALHKEELIPHETLDTKAEETARAKELARQRTEEQKAAPHREPFEQDREMGAARAEDARMPAEHVGLFAEEELILTAAETPGSYGAPSAAAGDRGTAGADGAAAGDRGTAGGDDAAKEARRTAGGDVAAKEARRTAGSDVAAPSPEDDFCFVDKTAQTGRFEQASLFAKKELASEKSAAQFEEQRQRLLSENILSFAEADTVFFGPQAMNASAENAAQDASAGNAENPGNPENVDFAGANPHLLTKENARQYRFIGQVFGTYWIIEYDEKLLMIDQHAAHEKVNFERLMARLSRDRQEGTASQLLMPPIIVNLSGREEAALEQYRDTFVRMGYEIEHFGENAYAIRAVPAELYANEPDVLLKEILDEILDSRLSGTPAAILYKIASMSCKAAIKGNTRMSAEEAQDLIDELLTLDNPYHCPHGRPTMIVLSRAEIDRKFKRIVS